MNVMQLIEGTLKVIPKTRDRWQARTIRLEGKQVNELFNTIKYRALSYGGTVGSGVYVMNIQFSGSGLGKSKHPTIHSNVRIKCSCISFKYWFANACLKGGAYYGNPNSWAKVASKRNNIREVAGACKHLILFFYTLLKNGEIKK